jgi:hypothetical protein
LLNLVYQTLLRLFITGVCLLIQRKFNATGSLLQILNLFCRV